MKKLSFTEKKIIKDFFNDNGYVLDFTNNSFYYFSIDSVGFSIQDKYKLSKGKSLEEFIENEHPDLVLKLVSDLLEYYFHLTSNNIYRNEENDQIANNIKRIVDKRKFSKCKINNSEIELTIDYFDSEYITKQIEIMTEMINKSPTVSIGKSKQLIESCYKYILDKQNIKYNNSDDLLNLQKKVFSHLNLSIKDNISAQNNQDVKMVLAGLSQIVKGINGLRNDKGDGHGKGQGYIELPERYARFVLNSTIALVNFVWETYEERNS